MDYAAPSQQGLAGLVKPMEELQIAANACAANQTQGSPDPNPPAPAAVAGARQGSASASASASTSATSSSMASTAGVVHLALFGDRRGLLAPDPEFAAFPGGLESSSDVCSLGSSGYYAPPKRMPIVFRDLRMPHEKAERSPLLPMKRFKRVLPVGRSRNVGVAGGASATGGAGDGNSSHTTQSDHSKLEQGGGGGGPGASRAGSAAAVALLLPGN